MGKRKNREDKEYDEEYIRKKIRKYERKLEDKSKPPRPTPPPPPETPPPPPDTPPPTRGRFSLSPHPPRAKPRAPSPLSPPSPQSSPTPVHHPTDEDEDIPEEFLLALGTEGEDKTILGDPIRSELVSRWSRIMCEGLDKEAKEAIVKRYPKPSNFSAATAPVLNAEILATLSEPSIKRDKRIVARQNLIGTLMTCLGKSLTNIIKGNINSKLLIEEINDAAKLAAEIHHQDSSSRKFFALAGANKTVQEAVRQSKSDQYLFGEDCAERIKAAQAIQKNCNNIKSADKDKKTKSAPSGKNVKQLNWRGPPQYQQPHRARGGQQNLQPPRRHYNQPHRKEKQQNYKAKSRYRRYN